MLNFIKKMFKNDKEIEKRLHYLESMDKEHREKISALVAENAKLKDRVDGLENENKETMKLLIEITEDLRSLEEIYLNSVGSNSYAVEEAKPIQNCTVVSRNIKKIAKEQKETA